LIADKFEERQLIADKFKNYNKNIRPARNIDEKVKVQVKLTLTNLISLVTNANSNTYCEFLVNRQISIQCINDLNSCKK